MASSVEILKSRFRGLFVIALLGLSAIFLGLNFVLSQMDPTNSIPPWLRFTLGVTQKLGTDFISLLVFSAILLYAIREEPSQEIASVNSRQGTKAIDLATRSTREFTYVGSTGAYNALHRIPDLANRAKRENHSISVSFFLPQPFLSRQFLSVVKAVGEEAPDKAALRVLAVAFKVLESRRITENLIVDVYFVSRASTIRYDITDDLIAMSSPLGRNPFVLFPKDGPMYEELRSDIKRLAETAFVKISTANDDFRKAVSDDTALAELVLNSVEGSKHGISAANVIQESRGSLESLYNRC